MKRQLRKPRVLLNRRYFGNSINAFVIAAAITAAFYYFYFAVLIEVQLRPATINVILNFFAIALLFRYATPSRVIRFCLRRIHEVASPWWFGWSQGHRLRAVFTPISVFLLVGALAVAMATLIMPKDVHKDHPSHHHLGLAPMVRAESPESFPCEAIDIDTLDLGR